MYYEDLKKIFIIDYEELQFDKNDGWTLIWIHEEPDGYLSGHDFFCIHGDKFYGMQSTRQDNDIPLKIIPNEPNENDSHCGATEICDDKICKKKRNFINNTPKHTLQRKRQKIQWTIGENHFMT